MKLSQILIISGYGLTVVLHTIGLFLLYKARGNLPNQRLVTMNLAAAELLYCLWAIIKDTVNPKSLPVVVFFDIFLYINIRSVIWHIIVDRFLDIWLNLKYDIYITKKVLTIIFFMQWAIGVTISMTFVLLFEFKIILPSKGTRKLICFIYLSFDIFIIITAISTFTYIFMTVRSIKQKSIKRQNKSGVLDVWLKLKIPSLMVLTFIVFNVNSTIMKLIYALYEKDNLVDPATFVDICGWLSDSIIYILLQRRIRILLRNRRKQEALLNLVNIVKMN